MISGGGSSSPLPNEAEEKALFNIAAWTCRPRYILQNNATGTGHLRGNGDFIPAGKTIRGLGVVVHAAGVTITHAQFGIYQWDPVGLQMVRLAASSDSAGDQAKLTATGEQHFDFTTPWTCPTAGWYYLAQLMSATTMPSLWQGFGAGIANDAMGLINGQWSQWYANEAGSMAASYAQAALIPTGDIPFVFAYM